MIKPQVESVLFILLARIRVTHAALLPLSNQRASFNCRSSDRHASLNSAMNSDLNHDDDQNSNLIVLIQECNNYLYQHQRSITLIAICYYLALSIPPPPFSFFFCFYDCFHLARKTLYSLNNPYIIFSWFINIFYLRLLIPLLDHLFTYLSS